MNINTSSRLGLYAVTLMAERPELVSAALVSKTYSVSENHVAKVLQQLSRAGLLKSVRGAHGGYQLAIDPAELSMLGVIEALEGPIVPTCYGCVGANAGKECNLTASCAIKAVLEEIGQYAYQRLSKIMISDLALRGKRLTDRLVELGAGR